MAGGENGPSYINKIQKFSFASDGNASDVGDLLLTTGLATGVSTATEGYITGGYQPAGGDYSNTIQKFPFAADGNTSDVADLYNTPQSHATAVV